MNTIQEAATAIMLEYDRAGVESVLRAFAKSLERPAHEPLSSLPAALADAMRHAFVPDMQTDSGSPFPFVDLMTLPGFDIGDGERRIAAFAEGLADAVMERMDSPPQAKEAGDSHS